MGKALFERATKLYTGNFSRWDDITHDPATQVQITLPSHPDRRTERWDGAAGTRAATAQELADYDDADRDARAAADLDAALNKTLRDLLLDIEQRLRAAGQNSTLTDIAAAGNQAEYTAALKQIVKSYL